MRSKMVALLAAGALLAGSSAAVAADASALSVVRAGASTRDASHMSGGGLAAYLTTVNVAIGIGVLALLVFLVVDGDGGNPVSPPASP